MKRICVDARLLGPTGIGTYLNNILPFLAREDLQWFYLTKPNAKLHYPFLTNGKVLETPTRVFSIRELMAFHRKIPPCDLFWSPHINAPLFCPQAKKRLQTLCDTYHFTFYDRLKKREKLYTTFHATKALQTADQIITISQFSKNEIHKHLPKLKNIKVISCGVDHNNFYPENNLENNKSYFLTVSSHKWHKNFERLLLAFEKTLHLHDKHLIVCGVKKGLINAIHLEKFLQSNLELQKRVTFLENISVAELRQWYQRAFGFIFPSFYEGFGLPPLEAMACGCPTLVSKTASIPEVCGNAATYFDPFSVESIKNSILLLLKDHSLREKSRENGLTQAKMFSWEKAAKEHLEILDTLLY